MGGCCEKELVARVPDHSTFSKNRHGRFRDSDLLRRVFETVLQRCIREGLVGGEAFAIDASLIKADANRQKGIEGEKGLPPEATGRAVEEYMAVLDDEAFGAATDVVPKFVSPADPAARWTGAHGGQAFFAYSTNYLIDVDNAIIVDVEATTAIRQAEVLAAKRMIERSLDRFDLYPARLLGDSAYGSAEMLGWLVYQHGIEPHVTVFDKSFRKDGTFSREDFTYDHVGDVYSCPAGKMLTTTGSCVNDGATLRYRASKYDCQDCRLKPLCCPKEPARYVPRSIYEGARDMARQIAGSSQGRTARRLRKKVEMLFAHLKRILRLDRLRLRGPNGIAVKTKTTKPPICQIEMDFLAQAPLGADAKAITDDQHPNHQLGINRWPPHCAVKRCEFAAQSRQLDKAVDRPRQMIGWYMSIEREVVEQHTLFDLP